MFWRFRTIYLFQSNSFALWKLSPLSLTVSKFPNLSKCNPINNNLCQSASIWSKHLNLIWHSLFLESPANNANVCLCLASLRKICYLKPWQSCWLLMEEIGLSPVKVLVVYLIYKVLYIPGFSSIINGVSILMVLNNFYQVGQGDSLK